MATVIIPNFLTQKVMNGLNSYQYTLVSTSVHNCRIEVSHQATSAITVSIAQAGSHSGTLATVTLPAGTDAQGVAQSTAILQAAANCVIGDTITFTVTSSSAVDSGLNSIVCKMNVHTGGLN